MATPAQMPLVLTAAQMRAVDGAAIEDLGVPGAILMENAGRGVAEVGLRMFPERRGLRVAIVCGTGNNGGDGFVAARHFGNRGASVQILLVGSRDRIGGEPAAFLESAERTPGVSVEACENDLDPRRWTMRFEEVDLLVDAIYGTGLRAEVAGAPAAAIQAMNRSPEPTLAVDIPSGLDADRGTARGPCIQAEVTATMAAHKLGLLVDAGAPVGRIELVDIGVSVAAVLGAAQALGPLAYILDGEAVRACLPRVGSGAHKGSRGHVLVVAGSAGKTGAAVLAARAALRSGAGLATVASTHSGQIALDAKVLEIMTARYTEGEDVEPDSFDRLLALAEGKRAVVLGPGIPVTEGMRTLVARVATELELPLVIDADGLNLLGTGAAAATRGASAARILTPHPGEMARLLGIETAEVQCDRVGSARGLARDSGAVVVLKGARTVIAVPDGTVYLCPIADASLGTAGSGDVLSGVLGALLGQGMDPAAAARAGVYVHARSAAEGRRVLGSRFLVAGDLPEAIARVLELELARDESDRDRASHASQLRQSQPAGADPQGRAG